MSGVRFLADLSLKSAAVELGSDALGLWAMSNLGPKVVQSLGVTGSAMYIVNLAVLAIARFFANSILNQVVG